MELLGAVAAALAAGVFIALGSRRYTAKTLRCAGVYLAFLAAFSIVLPFLTPLVRYGFSEARQVAPSLAAAVATAVGSAVLRLGVGLLEGLGLSWSERLGLARPFVVAMGALVPALIEVILRVDDVRAVSGVLPPVAVFDLLLPEIAPALLAGVLTSLWATRAEVGGH